MGIKLIDHVEADDKMDGVAIRDSIPMVAEGCRDSLPPPMVRHGSGGTYGIVDKYFKDRFVTMQIY